MTTTDHTPLTATATLTSWDETPGFGPDAPLPRLAHAEVGFGYEGQLTATSVCHYVLSYGADGAGEGVGYETVTGRRGDEEGTFVLRHTTEFGPDGVTGEATVVDGSGTGAFAGLTGSSRYQIGEGTQSWEWALQP